MQYADNFPAESLLFNKRQENRRNRRDRGEFDLLRQENRRTGGEEGERGFEDVG